MFTRRQLARKSTVGAAQSRSQSIKKTFVTLGCGGRSGTKVMFVHLHHETAWEKSLLTKQYWLVEPSFWRPSSCPWGRISKGINPPPWFPPSCCLSFEGVPICDEAVLMWWLLYCESTNTNDVQTFKVQPFYNTPKLIPRAFLGRGREQLWHMDQIWWFVWNWSVSLETDLLSFYLLCPLLIPWEMKINQCHIV